MEPMERDEDVLRDILCRMCVEKNAARDRDDRPVLAMKERFERAALTFACECRIQA